MNPKMLNDDLDLVLKAVDWAEIEPGPQAFRDVRYRVSQLRQSMDKIRWQKSEEKQIVSASLLIGSNSSSWSEELSPISLEPSSQDIRAISIGAKCPE